MSLLGIVATVFLMVAHSVQADVNSCGSISLSPPLLRKLQLNSKFNPTKAHYGADYAANGDAALAVADGVLSKIAWNAKALETQDHRSGALVKGWGRYVILTHSNGSQTLYAHLEKDSTQLLKVGQAVKKGDRIGTTDSTGGVSGPHLHLEYSPRGNVLLNSTKVDPNVCVFRQGWVTIESYLVGAKGICQLFLDGRSVGENFPGTKTKISLSLGGGKHELQIVAKQIIGYQKAYCSIGLDEPFTIFDSSGADVGPGLSENLEQGQSVKSTLMVW